jgi:hypothetical protein
MIRRYTREIKSSVAMVNTVFKKNKESFHQKADLNLKKKQINCYIWSVAFCGAEIWKLRKVFTEKSPVS